MCLLFTLDGYVLTMLKLCSLFPKLLPDSSLRDGTEVALEDSMMMHFGNTGGHMNVVMLVDPAHPQSRATGC